VLLLALYPPAIVANRPLTSTHERGPSSIVLGPMVTGPGSRPEVARVREYCLGVIGQDYTGRNERRN